MADVLKSTTKIENYTRVSEDKIHHILEQINKSGSTDNIFYYKISGHLSTKIKITRKHRVTKGTSGKDDKHSYTYLVHLYFGDGKQTPV